MSLVTINDTTLFSIGDAIREKNGTTDTYKPSEMPQAILSIESGSSETITDNKVLLESDYEVDTLVDNNIVNLRAYAFYQNYNIKNVILNKVEIINSSAFDDCLKLESAQFPSLKQGCGIGAFSECSVLKFVDFGSGATISNVAFRNCSSLETLILRKNSIVALLSNALENTAISKGTGYIYVPSTIVDSYKADSNWSTYANQIRAIEDYPDICGS